MRLFPVILLALLAAPAAAQDVPLPRPRPADRPPAADTTLPADETPLPALPAPAPLEVPEVETAAPDRPDAPSETVSPDPPEAPSEVAPPVGAPEPPSAEPLEPPDPPEPPEPYQSACPAVIMGLVDAELLPPIAEGDCVADSPLSVTAVRVNGRTVPLSSPATVSCAMATQLPAWASAVDGYLEAKENTRLAEIRAGTSYACRNVNNAAKGSLSAHAFADALDVTGFALEDGRTIALPEGWTDPLSLDGRALRFAHDAACSVFSTTLGPEANALHEDHLHLDVACHGSRCTARLCE